MGCDHLNWHLCWSGLAEAGGFEPPVLLSTLAFKFCAHPFESHAQCADLRQP